MTSKTFPGFSNTYVLREASDTAFRGRVPPEFDGWKELRAEARPAAPIEIHHAMGRGQPSDFVYTTSAIPIIISDRVVRVFKAEGFTGWETYPTRLFGKDGSSIPGYHGLAVHGRCGPIDDTRSVKLDRIMPGGVFPGWYGLYFDPLTWDGSDVFMPSSDQAWVFMVGAVKQALQKAKLTNMKFNTLEAQHVPRLT